MYQAPLRLGTQRVGIATTASRRHHADQVNTLLASGKAECGAGAAAPRQLYSQARRYQHGQNRRRRPGTRSGSATRRASAEQTELRIKARPYEVMDAAKARSRLGARRQGWPVTAFSGARGWRSRTSALLESKRLHEGQGRIVFSGGKRCRSSKMESVVRDSGDR
jgi:hypothetical protein